MKCSGVRMLHLLVTALVVTACAPSTTTPQASSSTQPAAVGGPAAFNADDVGFATNMVASFQQTTQLTALVPVRSTNPDVLALAVDVNAAQRPDFETVKVFLVQWNSDSDENARQGGNASAAAGVVDDDDVKQLATLRGRDFDGAWLQFMIGHLQGAVAVAQAELAHGVNVDAVATAHRFVSTLGAQLERVRQCLRAVVRNP